MRRLSVAFVLACTCLVGGCIEYEELPDSVCPRLVTHARALLGPGAKDKTNDEMMAACKASTPKQRGCAMVARVGSDIMKCSLVR